MLVNVQKRVDNDLAKSGTGFIDLVTEGQRSASKYPKMVTEIMVCDTEAGDADYAPVNLTLQGGGERVVLRLRCGEKHEMAVKRIYAEHTDVNGLVVFGVR